MLVCGCASLSKRDITLTVSPPAALAPPHTYALPSPQGRAFLAGQAIARTRLSPKVS